MRKMPDGTVLPDESRCLGCWTCMMVCPYGAIRRSPAADPVAVKCDLCADLDEPACVANCPNRALEVREENPIEQV
jgi:carbon-monoxide dehydrogenase iron sulfur subunit